VVAALIYFRRQGAHDPSLAILGRGVAGHLLSSASASISSPTSTAAHCAPNCPPTGSWALPPCSGHGICGYAAWGSVAVVWLFSYVAGLE
jgi:hypothetical protein